MKNWIKKHEAFFKSWQFKLGVFLLLGILMAGLFIGKAFYGYVMAIGVFALFYYFTMQAQSERIVSPNEMKQMEAELAELEEEADFIREHIAENPGDLDAKLLLRDLERSIETMKETLVNK